MSILYLIRHGQASFGTDNYDKLSEIGIRQSEELGGFLAGRKLAFDAVYTGSHKRQIDTALLVCRQYKQAGLAFPDHRIIPDFNEYDAQSIITTSMPTVLKQHPELMELFQRLSRETGVGNPQGKKDFQKLFSKVMEYWVSGRLKIKGIEGWPEFTERVGRGLAQVMDEQGPSKTVAVFTSGGPISVAVQRALGTKDQTTLDLGWVARNTALNEFRYSPKGFALYSFNETPHLPSPDLVTYR